MRQASTALWLAMGNLLTTELQLQKPHVLWSGLLSSVSLRLTELFQSTIPQLDVLLGAPQAHQNGNAAKI